jgi:DnaJ-class molecular chaperone
MYVEINVVIPSNLTSEEKELFEKLKMMKEKKTTKV